MEKDIIKSFKTVKEVEDYRAKINEECDSRVDFINSVRKADSLSNKSFGYIKECFEAISPKLFETKEGKVIINKYMSAIKGNENLSIMHGICEAIRKAGKESNYVYFMNKILEETRKLDRPQIKEDVKSLGNILAEGYCYIGKDAEEILPNENKKLYAAVDYISENVANLKHMTEYSNAMMIIEEHLKGKDSVVNICEVQNLDDLASELLEEFNKKYSDSLNEEEAKVLKEIASSENREEIFNKYKAMCSESISKAKKSFEEKGETSSVNRLSTVLEQVNNKKFSLDTVGEDICNLIELSNIFD